MTFTNDEKKRIIEIHKLIKEIDDYRLELIDTFTYYIPIDSQIETTFFSDNNCNYLNPNYLSWKDKNNNQVTYKGNFQFKFWLNQYEDENNMHHSSFQEIIHYKPYFDTLIDCFEQKEDFVQQFITILEKKYSKQKIRIENDNKGKPTYIDVDNFNISIGAFENYLYSLSKISKIEGKKTIEVLNIIKRDLLVLYNQLSKRNISINK